MEDTSPEENKPTARVSPNMLASALDSPNIHTSFGNLPLGKEKTSPGYTFGKGTRKQQDRIFHHEELLTTSGKTSPGPKYLVKDNLSFKNVPHVSIGNEPRRGFADIQRYDHYNVIDNFSNTSAALDATKPHYGGVKFGTDGKNTHYKLQDSPGPQYFPSLKGEIRNAPQYTIGSRRRSPNGNMLEHQGSTTRIVGPGAYSPEASLFNSALKNSSKWSIPRGERMGRSPEPAAKNETYDNRSTSCGVQILSKLKTSPQTKIGSSTRDQISRLGVFKDAMSSVRTSVRVAHPNF